MPKGMLYVDSYWQRRDRMRIDRTDRVEIEWDSVERDIGVVRGVSGQCGVFWLCGVWIVGVVRYCEIL